MKLSAKDAAEFGLAPWEPVELATATPPLSEEGVEHLMDIFKPTPGTEALAGTSANRVLKAEKSQTVCSPWRPGEALGLVSEKKADQWIPVSAWEDVETPATVKNSAQAEAQKIIAEAKAQAAEILADTRKQVDTIILNAHEEGWLAAQAETEEMLATARSIVEQVTQWRDEMLAKSQDEVLDLVRVIAQRMFGEGIALPTETLQEAFNLALQEARALGDLRLYIHPEDASNLDPYWRDFQVAIGGHQIKIVPSDAIRRGGCFIDGELGSVDARVDTQLKSIMEVLDSSRPEKESPE